MMETCSCVGCDRRADRYLAGRMVCDECYLSDKPLFFNWPERKTRALPMVLIAFIVFLIVSAVSLGAALLY